METERQLKDFGQILKYAKQYKANCIYHIRYQKSKDKDRYLRQHETELLLHDGAENMLKRFGINLKNLDIEKLCSDYNALFQKRQLCRKPINLPKKKSTTLTGNWITSTNILAAPLDSRILIKKQINTLIPAKFPI